MHMYDVVNYKELYFDVFNIPLLRYIRMILYQILCEKQGLNTE